MQDSLAKPPAERPPVPREITEAARLRREGRFDDAAQVVEAALAKARATPFDVPFRDRVLLGLALADLYVLTDQCDRAQTLLNAEVTFADNILALIRQSGSRDQVHAAMTGCLQLRDRVAQAGLLGASAPEIEVEHWVLGRPTTLAEQRGRVVLLEFWARSCRSCLAMLPALHDLHTRHHRNGLTVLALTRYSPEGAGVDRLGERELIAGAVTDRGVQIPVGIAPDGRLQQLYGARGIPTFVLVDRAGDVRFATSTPDKARL